MIVVARRFDVLKGDEPVCHKFRVMLEFEICPVESVATWKLYIRAFALVFAKVLMPSENQYAVTRPVMS